MNNLIYEDKPRYDLWLKLILAGPLATTFILGVVFFPGKQQAALVMFAVTLFDALLFHAVMPRRFQIFQDKLKIFLGRPFVLNIPLSTIREVQSVSGSKVFAYGGIRLATSTHYIVEIVRRKGLSLIISPAKADVFLEQLKQAIFSTPELN